MNMKKNKSHYPLNWPAIAADLKDEFDYTCQDCGVQFDPGDNIKYVGGKKLTLTVHHKDRETMNCEKSNLIVLCSPCHCRVELPLIRAEMRAKRYKNQMDAFAVDDQTDLFGS